MNKYVRKTLKIILWFFGILLVLAGLALLAIQLPFIQRIAKNKAVTFIERKIGTPVVVERLTLDFPKRIVLEGVYFEDQAGDTLLAGDTLKVDISFLKLLSNQVMIHEIDLRGITAYVNRTLPDSAYNFDYILNAFTKEEKKDARLDSASTMKFSVSKINMDRIRVNMTDEVFGNDLYVYLQHFDTHIERFDPDRQEYNVPKIKLTGVRAQLLQSKALNREVLTVDTLIEKPAFTYPDIKVNELDISDIQIDYKNTVTAINSNLDLENLLIAVDELDLQNKEIDLRLIKLENTSGLFELGATAQQAVEATATEVAETLEKGWIVNLDKLDLKEISFQYDDLNQKEKSAGIDYSHLAIRHLNADIADIYYQSDSLTAKVEALTLEENSGLQLQQFEGDVAYGSYGASVDNFILKTPRSKISERIVVSYPSLDSIAKNITALGFSANFNHNEIAVSDLLLVAPALKEQAILRKNPNAIILVNGNLEGNLSSLELYNVSLSGLGNIQLKASGSVQSLPDVKRLYADLDIDQLSLSENDIKSLAGANAIPATIRLPQQLSLQGSLKGSLNNFSTNTRLQSSFGAAHFNGTFKNMTLKGREAYDAKIATSNFDLGKLLKKEDQLGQVSMQMDVAGSGTDPKTAKATLKGVIDEIHFNHYTYQNLAIDGKANDGVMDVDAKMTDPNATFDLIAHATLNGTYPTLEMDMQIDSINLQPLNLYKKDLRFRGHVTADLETADPDYLNGTIGISDLALALDGETYRLDTMSIVSVATPEEDSLFVRSEFLFLDLHGQYQLTQLPSALQGTISRYFDLAAGATAKPYEPQQIDFEARLVRSPLIEELFPDLEEMQDATLIGNFDSSTGDIKIEGNIPRLGFKDFVVSDLTLDIHNEGEALQYAFTLDQINSKQFRVVNTSLTGKAKDDVLDYNLLVKDVDKKDHYRIAGDLTVEGPAYILKLYQDGLILNYDAWNVSPANSIQFGKEGLMATDFTISNAGQSLSINSTPQQPDAPIDITFTDFQIETLTRFVTKDSLYAGGNISGEANISQLKTNPVFTANLNIEDFSFQGDTLGQVAMNVNNATANTYAAEIVITGDGNQVNILGKYTDTGESNLFDLDIDIDNLNVKSIEGFTMGQIDDGSGSITGNMKFTGTLQKPEIRGDVYFRNAGFRVTKFNSYFRALDEHISFTPEGISLNEFILLDSAGNEAVFSGRVITSDYRDFRFGLTMNADDFQVLNSTRRDNKLFYGRLFIDTRMNIAGGINNPVVDGTLSVNEKTQLTVVVPQENPGIVERQGIIEFIDADTVEFKYLTATADSLVRTEFTGMDVAVQITIDREADLSLIIDEVNGDYLNVKGVANLTGGVDPSGKVTLTGQYEIDEGVYSFSFNQLKREFIIQEGSSINWTGEPLTADVNVTAVYIAEAAPLSLVENQLGESDQSVINTYKQKLPFEIFLTMTGELLRPVVSFDIQLPEETHSVSPEVIATVQSRLSQIRTEPSELNKQVFAVLLLNRFISDDPFQNSAGGTGISSFARQSASKLLSEQLNNLVGGMVAGFDLNFDINSVEDYTTGELQNRTDLTVGLSRRLLDDRLNISIGSNFELEGPQETDRKSTNIAGDISAEYQLSADGRYLVRAYRKDEYIVVQGQVVETGLGFVFTADYEKLKDLFAKKTEEEKVLRRNLRAQRKQERKTNE